MSQVDSAHAWWSRLRHQGLLLSPVVMLERYATAPEPAHFSTTARLRDAYTRFVSTAEMRRGEAEIEQSAILAWVDALLDPYVGHRWGRLARQGSIPERLTAVVRIGTRSETIRPHRVVYADANATVPALLIMADTSAQVGRGRGRTAYARFLELLRSTGHRLGLLTNGYQFRLVYAGLDFESWCEWEADRWFDDGEGTEELGGLRQLLTPEALKPVREGVSGLLDAVEESRKRQADLSSVLRENVRQAVEYLLEDVSAANRTAPDLFNTLVCQDGGPPLTDAQAHEALHQATVRIVMRLVVCLFAESRRLLPVNDPIYSQAYGVRSLYERLEEAVRMEGGIHTLFNHHTAWARMMALFRLIYSGSAHGAFPLRAYGGILFRPGERDDPDPVSRALHLLEHAVPVGDATLHAVLRKLMRGPLPVLRGRQKTFVEGPVDYTDLRTEFIGLIYEGLLDYRVKRTDAEIGPQVFLNLGREPVLPLNRLEEMLANDRNGLKNLLTTLRKETVTAKVASEEEAEEEAADEPGDAPENADADGDAEIEVDTPAEEFVRGGDYLDAVASANRWAAAAVVLAGLVGRQKARESDGEYQARIEAEAKRLIKRVVATGEFYLVRAGNTRKGTGTFYTRPQLSVPTVHRTLEPLCFDKAADGTTTPKPPEVILGLKVCDPACGSGSFLVGALHYLTDALYKSLSHHRHLDDSARSKRITLPLGRPRSGVDTENLVPFPPDDPKFGHLFEERVKALLRRHIVERCLYGVDLNPLAVEFARVSLWVETLDAELPFSFLDHKLKVGNSLVGCWLDRVKDYPLRAWEREGGDGKDGPRTQIIESFLNGEKVGRRRAADGRVKQEMREFIRLVADRAAGQQVMLPELDLDIERVVEDARTAYEALHDQRIDDQDGQEDRYRAIERSEPVRRLRRAMDEWCAVWFWPADHESMAHVPTPLTFHRESEGRSSLVARLADDLRFFHWELAFPDVFTPMRSGFDAMIGNPPWDVLKPNSHEFFSNFDPLYRGLDKKAAIRRQRDLFTAIPTLLTLWDEYNARFKALGNWARSASEPFNLSLSRGKEGTYLARTWEESRRSRMGYADCSHPFRHQGGGDLNLYKLFLEASYRLGTESGRVGLIVPSGLYSDSGTGKLRELLLGQAEWEWLFCFENKKKIFDIHRSYKFCAIIWARIEGRSVHSQRLRVAFMVHDLAEWERSEPVTLDFDRSVIPLISPHSKALPELRSIRELHISRTIYSNSSGLLFPETHGRELRYGREYHSSDDSRHFMRKAELQSEGFQSSDFGQLLSKMDRAQPLYQGRMMAAFDPVAQRYAFISNQGSKWMKCEHDRKTIEPQYYMLDSFLASSRKAKKGLKLIAPKVARSTDSRTMSAAIIVDFPSIDSLNSCQFASGNQLELIVLLGIMNSLSYDFALRSRLTGANMSEFIISESPYPKSISKSYSRRLIIASSSLNFIHRRFAPDWLKLKRFYPELSDREWKQCWAVREADRLRLRVEIDALCANLYGLDPDDFDWIVRDDPSDPKGFYRVDRQLSFRERLTGLAAAAFRMLKEGKWSAESAAEFSNDAFFDLLGIPELTNAAAAHSAGLSSPLIEKRDGCHIWKPEAFPADDPRHGWTWDDCWNDAVALLGGDEAVQDYISDRKSVETVQDGERKTPLTLLGTSEASPTEEPFRLASDRISLRKQGRLNFNQSMPTASVPTRQPSIFDDADPRIAQYLAVFVRIIAAHRGMTGQRVLGRKKVEKLVHVIETHLGLDLGRRPIRAAAGPLDMERHKAVCRIAEERDILRAIEPERSAVGEDDASNPREAVRFEPLGRFDQAVKEAATTLGDLSGKVDGLIAHLMKLNPAQAEIVATLYAVWNDLIQVGNSPRDEELFGGVWAWHPDKAKFTQTEMFVELAWMRQVGIIPRR